MSELTQSIAYQEGYAFFDEYTGINGIESVQLGFHQNPYIPSRANVLASSGIGVVVNENNNYRLKVQGQQNINEWIKGYKHKRGEVISHEDDWPFYGKRIRSERNHLFWTLEKTAFTGRVNKSSHLLYEMNERQPSLHYMIRLGLHGADLQMLLFGEPFDDSAGDKLDSNDTAQMRAYRSVIQATGAHDLTDLNTDYLSRVTRILQNNEHRIDECVLGIPLAIKAPSDKLTPFLWFLVGVLLTYLVMR